jgi:hypothetical protein
MTNFRYLLLFLALVGTYPLAAQQRYELNSGWQGMPIGKVSAAGPQLSQPAYPLTGWQPAVVPGTVLTTLQNRARLLHLLVCQGFSGITSHQQWPGVAALPGRELQLRGFLEWAQAQ